MIIKCDWNLLVVSQAASLDIPGKIEDFNLTVSRIKHVEALASPAVVSPDMLLALDDDPDLRGKELIEAIRKQEDSIPVVLVVSTLSLEYIKEIFDAGGFGYIRRQHFQEDLYALLMRQQHLLHERQENVMLVQDLSNLTVHLQEKNAIFKTIFDLISHDTKNLFYYISTIINQVQEKNLKEMLENSFHELNDCLLEAYGYLRDHKRILSAAQLLENLRLERTRIILKSHPRIQLQSGLKYLLYIEVSALFKNALVNIIENALKFSPDSTQVRIELVREQEEIVFRIIDQGPGIPAEDRNLVFERNFRIKRTQSPAGSGKGLWITHTIIEKENGSIEITANPDGGTIFTVKIPAFRVKDFQTSLQHLSEWFRVPPLTIEHKATTFRTFLEMQKIDEAYDYDSIVFANVVQTLRDESRARDKKPFHRKLSELQKLNPHGKSVLIIDDSIHVHYYLGTHLTQIGFRIAGYARDGAAGLSYYKSLQPDLVTMDSTMPIMSGTEAAIEIVKTNPNARILFVTGVGGHPRFINTLSQNLPEENYRIITKPFKKEDLEAMLAEFI